MNKIVYTICSISLVTAMLLSLSACDQNDGPLEKAGESIDETATDLGNKIEDACEDVKEGMNADDTRC